jgi:hypothetical protein
MALKSSCSFGVLGAGGGEGTEAGTPAATGAGAIGALAGAVFSWAGLAADGFAATVPGVGLPGAVGALGFSGVIGCDCTGAVLSAGGSVAAALGGTVAGAGAGGSVTAPSGAGGGTAGTEACSDRCAPWCTQAVKPMSSIIARQAHSRMGPVYARWGLSTVLMQRSEREG